MTSIVATLVLVTYLTDKESNVTVGLGFCLARVYTLTFLYNLNTRPRFTTTDPSSTGVLSMVVFEPTRTHTVDLDSMGGIRKSLTRRALMAYIALQMYIRAPS